jgi:transcriptional regulator with XRE-family HTH domain
MDNFFKKYKKLRVDQKIDLADIENRTKINIKYLTALETGNFDLIQEPYTRLFLRAYINEIGADPDAAISELAEYLLKKDGSKSKNPEQENNTTDEIKKDVSVPSEKKSSNFQNISLGVSKKIVNRQTSIPPNLIKGILFLIFWVIIIIVIRNITLENKNEIPNALNSQMDDNNISFTNFQQIQADFLEISSLQTAIEQSLPLIVKIVSKNSLGLVSTQDSLEIKSFSITAGDQRTYSFDTNLDILLNHSEGVTVFINGDAIQDIRSQQTPVRLIFSIEPKSVTIKHYSKVG